MTTTTGKVTGSGGGGFSAEIRVEGLEETIAALRSLEPDVLKTMQREIREALGKIKAEASGSVPRPATGSYVLRTSQRGKRAGMKLVATEKWTAVFEFAGTKGLNREGTGPATPQGAAMIRWLDGFGKPGRYLWGAWDRNKTAFEAELKAAIGKAERELQRKLNSAGEVF